MKEAVDAEANKLRTQLTESEGRLQAFKSEWGLFSAEQQKDQLIKSLSEAENDLSEAQKNSLATQERMLEIAEQLELHSTRVPLSSVRERNPLVDKLRDELVKLELERSQFVEGSPAAERLKRDINGIKTKLQGTVDSLAARKTQGLSNTYQELQKVIAIESGNKKAFDARINANKRQIEKHLRKLRLMEGLEPKLRNMEREVRIKEEVLELFLKKGEELRISNTFDAKKISNVFPIELAAVPGAADKPNKKLIIIIGFILGIGGGISFAYMSDFFRRTIATSEEALDAFGRPVSTSLMCFGKNSAGSEIHNLKEFGLLRERLLQESAPDVGLCCLVTSSVSGEGKSYVVQGVAESLRQRGISVLVIRTRLHSQPDAEREETASTSTPMHAAAHGVIFNVDRIDVEGDYNQVDSLVVQAIHKFKQRYRCVLIDCTCLSEYPGQVHLYTSINKLLFVVEADHTASITASRNLALLDDANRNEVYIVLNKRNHVIPDWAYRRFLSSRTTS